MELINKINEQKDKALAKSNQECSVHQNKNMVPGTRHKDYIKGKAFIYLLQMFFQAVCMYCKKTYCSFKKEPFYKLVHPKVGN